jgi:hypothetical protein
MTDKELSDFIEHGSNRFMEFALVFGDGWASQAIEIAKELRTRLAQPEPEPVAWMEIENYLDEENLWDERKVLLEYDNGKSVPLYTAPQKKEWVGLTDDDVNYFVDAIYKGFDMKPRNEVEIAYFERLIKFVGAKLEDKNT